MSDSSYGDDSTKITDLIEEPSDSILASTTSNSKLGLANKQQNQASFKAIVSNQRLHKLNQGFEEIKRHRWFISITNWNDVNEKRLKPPFRPELMHDGDTRNFEKYETPDFSKTDCVSDKQLEVFCNF